MMTNKAIQYKKNKLTNFGDANLKIRISCLLCEETEKESVYNRLVARNHFLFQGKGRFAVDWSTRLGRISLRKDGDRLARCFVGCWA